MRVVNCLRTVVVVLLALAAVCAPAAAQPVSRLRVTMDGTSIWRPGFRTLATVVNSGTILDAVSRQDEWYEVLLPSPDGLNGATGMIYAGRVELVEGSEPPRREPAGSRADRLARARESDPDAAISEHPVGVRGFFSFGYDWMAAHKSFDAVIGQPGGLIVGGGAQLRWNQFEIEGTVERFRHTGERVFVTDAGEVFKLGIPDTITIIPIKFSVQYRFTKGIGSPYVGGGAGGYRYKEESKFADPSENVDRRFTGYHVFGGYEVRNGLLATAVEVQYVRIPDALSGGAASVFNEHNLGGVQLRVKILVGR